MSIPDLKPFFGFVSAVAAVVGLFPYLSSILGGKTVPHLFTWLVWTVLTVMIFLIQVESNAGPGAWGTGLTAATCIVILGLTIVYGERRGTPYDWLALWVSLLTIPLWLFTKDSTFSAL